MSDPDRISKVIVCATCYADASQIISLGSIIANWAESELAGVLVQEEDYLASFGTKTSRMMTYVGLPVEAATDQNFQSISSADAKAFETALKRSALSDLRAWTFSCSRGEVSKESLSLAQRDSIVLIGHRRLNRFASTLLLVCGIEIECTEAIRLTVSLAAKLGASITPISFDAPHNEPSREAVLLQELCQAAHVHVEPLRFVPSKMAILEAVNRSTALALVTNAGTGITSTVADLQQLRMAARCPIILVGKQAHDLTTGENNVDRAHS